MFRQLKEFKMKHHRHCRVRRWYNKKDCIYELEGISSNKQDFIHQSLGFLCTTYTDWIITGSCHH